MQTTNTKIAITGNTYPVREQLKALGATWDRDRKAWMVLPEKADEARRIVSRSPLKGPSTYTGPRTQRYAPHGATCPYCSSRTCNGAFGGLCDED